MGACHARAYVPRATPRSDLARIVRAHLPAFVEHAELADAPLPAFVKKELEGLCTCGDFDNGFVRLNCTRCGHELRVPFACKARGTCPSCMGRRMGETASLWVDHLVPATPYRQWVLSLDGPMAVRLGYDTELLSLVSRSFSSLVAQTLRRLAKHQHRLKSVTLLHPGTITVVQRFRADGGLFVHIHLLATDGVFEAMEGAALSFRPVSGLDNDALFALLERLHAKLDPHLEDDPDIDP